MPDWLVTKVEAGDVLTADELELLDEDELWAYRLEGEEERKHIVLMDALDAASADARITLENFSK